MNLIEKGVSGFIGKNENPEELIKTIRGVHEKGFYINDHILNLIRNQRLLKTKNSIKLDLSKREQEVLKLICAEYTNKEIAEELNISFRTVEGHRNKILLKTKSKNTVGIVLFAIEHNLIDVSVSKFKY